MDVANTVNLYTRFFSIDVNHKGWYYSIKIFPFVWIYLLRCSSTRNKVGKIVKGKLILGFKDSKSNAHLQKEMG